MKITYNWLKEYIDIPWDWPELVERLTMAGLEREETVDLTTHYRGVVVGQVLSRNSHPNADRLSLCRVNVGEDELDIVCGAPNVAEGQKVAVILPGFRLPDGTEIRRTKIRGVESSGMICSEVELGIGEDASGILVLPDGVVIGRPFAEEMGMDDVHLDFEVTPNRPDCLSLIGIAREVRALTGNEIRFPSPDLKESEPATHRAVAIDIQDEEGCPRYVARVIRGITVTQSPAWLKRRLMAVGQRPINNVVDATNFVMLESGQPLHAFDLSRIGGETIRVRRAKPGEKLKVLDGTECELDKETLVIADADAPVALAGIMGGADSAVGAETADILLESAYFDPVRIRRASAKLGLKSESSMRFERGADPEMARLAIDRVADLISQLTGGEIAKDALDTYVRKLPPVTVAARVSRINQLLATDLDSQRMQRILQLLGCDVAVDGNSLKVTVPGFRPDLTREVDLAEEVGRIYGYDRIESSSLLRGPLIRQGKDVSSQASKIKQQLTGLGLDEVTTNTIVELYWLEMVGASATEHVTLANPPTEDLRVLRTSLLPSLLDVARRNLNHRAHTVAIFELGKCFSAHEANGETLHLSGLWIGRTSASTWQGDRKETDLLDLKGLLEAFIADVALEFVQDQTTAYQSGQCARLQIGGVEIGSMGEVSESLRSAFDIDHPVYAFQLSFNALLEHRHRRQAAYNPLPRFPSIERDLAVLIRKEVKTADVVREIQKAAPDLIESVELFDLYEGDQIPVDQKSLAFSVCLRSSTATLEDQQANDVIEQVLAKLKKSFDAVLRIR